MENDQFSVRKVSEDARGSIYEFCPAPNTHLNLLTMHKGMARGGHSHQYPETFFILRGAVEYHSGTIEHDEKSVYCEGATIRTTPGEAHYMLALEETCFIECRPTHTLYQAEDYLPFRALVLQLMRRPGAL